MGAHLRAAASGINLVFISLLIVLFIPMVEIKPAVEKIMPGLLIALPIMALVFIFYLSKLFMMSSSYYTSSGGRSLSPHSPRANTFRPHNSTPVFQLTEGEYSKSRSGAKGFNGAQVRNPIGQPTSFHFLDPSSVNSLTERANVNATFVISVPTAIAYHKPVTVASQRQDQ